MVSFFSSFMLVFIGIGTPLIMGHLMIKIGKRKKESTRNMDETTRIIQISIGNWMISIGILLWLFTFLAAMMILGS